MNIKTRVLALIFFGCLSTYNLFGQQKYEKESRLNKDDIPQIAKQFIDSMRVQKKVKWYYEENLLGNSIEAKFKFNEKKYSIEFDTLGHIQDVEILIDWNQINTNTQQAITSHLNSIFSKHKICKIQIQFTGERKSLLATAINTEQQNAVVTKYEIIIKGRKKARPKLYEITFSEAGKLLKTDEIIFKNSDNLEY